MSPNVFLFEVQASDRTNYMDLLLLADESREKVSEYLYQGDMFRAAGPDGTTIGVTLIIPESAEKVEIKNLAVAADCQGQGYGRAIIDQLCAIYRGKGFKTLAVGTANSSISNLAFYQKAGFRMTEIRRDFFASYPEPILENGIRALDMVMFERRL
jgi:ribosomal protein S18 acetylase RimI-like enzyme